MPTGGIVNDAAFDQNLNCGVGNVHKPGSVIISVINDPDKPGKKILRARNFEKQDFYKVQQYQENRAIANEHFYSLSYRAQASSARRISAQVYQGVSVNATPWQDDGLWATPNLGSAWQPETHCFISTATATDARVGFVLHQPNYNKVASAYAVASPKKP